MNLIQNNPYRTTGLLVGATAKEQTKQISRLKRYIEAEQDPQDDFSFPVLGDLHRTIESVEEAASKLNLDNDKINAALFWFWNGNPITDEAAFENLKSGDIDAAYEIWDKLITKTDEEGKRFWKPVTEKNYSAFHNCSVLNIIRRNGNLHNSILASLYFLESDLVHKFVSSVADETHKTSKKELQLIFLNKLQSDIEANKKSSLPKFLEILNKQEFVAKQDFMKGFVQKPIEQIEHKIETAKNKRKASKASAAKAGQELFTAITNDLIQLKNIVGANDLKYTSIADKAANEILQCSIDFFNDSQEQDSNTDYTETAMKLAKQAETLAVGKLTKDRVEDNVSTLEEIKQKNLCWYCKKNTANIKYSHSVEIYKEIYRSSWYETKKTVRFQKAQVHIPRCKNCYEIHHQTTWYSGCLFNSALWLIWYLITLAVLDVGLFWSIPISGIPAIIVYLVISSIVSSNNAKKNNILKETNIENFPPYLQLLKEGWITSEPTV